MSLHMMRLIHHHPMMLRMCVLTYIVYATCLQTDEGPHIQIDEGIDELVENP